MNSYTMTFAANCPTNGVRTNYTWRIDSKAVLMVEAIVAIVESVESGEPAFHEEIADRLAESFEGEHTLTAYHHGVLIETKRDSRVGPVVGPLSGARSDLTTIKEQGHE